MKNNIENYTYCLIDAYIDPEDKENWLCCPNCGLTPKVWEFDNGKSTGCGCGKNRYDHFSIYAESILSYVNRNNGSLLGYHSDELRKNWNHWVETGIILFDRGQ